MEITDVIKLQTRQNKLYCIIIKSGFDIYLDSEFTSIMSKYLNSYDGNFIAGSDVKGESIYFTYVDKYKVFKMVDFFKKHNILLKHYYIDDVINFINSDPKFLEVYSDDYNKIVLDNYIKNNITIDDILDKIIENEKLSDIEINILNKKSKEILFSH